MPTCSSTTLRSCSFSCCNKLGSCAACASDCYRTTSGTFTSVSFTSTCRSSTSSTSSSSATIGGLSVAAVANIAVWVSIAGLILIGVGIYYCCKKKNQPNTNQQLEKSAEHIQTGANMYEINPTQGPVNPGYANPMPQPYANPAYPTAYAEQPYQPYAMPGLQPQPAMGFQPQMQPMGFQPQMQPAMGYQPQPMGYNPQPAYDGYNAGTGYGNGAQPIVVNVS